MVCIVLSCFLFIMYYAVYAARLCITVVVKMLVSAIITVNAIVTVRVRVTVVLTSPATLDCCVRAKPTAFRSQCDTAILYYFFGKKFGEK